jgi:hypothetical protein
MTLKKTNIVFLAELLAQWRAHDRASHAGGLSEESYCAAHAKLECSTYCIVMSLSRLSPRGVES